MVGVLKGGNRMSGPALYKRDRLVISAMNMKDEFHVQLNRIKADFPNLIPYNTQVEEVYGISTPFRIGSESRAIEQLAKDTDIDLISRWQIIERNKGQRPLLSMR